jgi:hypothetical protein
MVLLAAGDLRPVIYDGLEAPSFLFFRRPHLWGQALRHWLEAKAESHTSPVNGAIALGVSCIAKPAVNGRPKTTLRVGRTVNGPQNIALKL